VKHSVVDFIEFGLLKRSHNIAILHRANEFVFGLRQAFGLAPTPNLIETLLASIASAVDTCGLTEPINRCLDTCGGSDLLYGVS
jgi:hypothetical protein